MRHIEYLDPIEAQQSEGHTVHVNTFPNRLQPTATKAAIELWKFSKRRVTDARGNVVLNYADTMTAVFAKKIEEFLSDPVHLARHFHGKRPTDAFMAKRAGFSRAKWNRLSGGALLDIERGNAFAVAIALKLDEKQTEELLYAGGFVLNYEHELDCAIMYFIKQGIYDMELIKATLSQFCDITNGLDTFTFNPK